MRYCTQISLPSPLKYGIATAGAPERFWSLSPRLLKKGSGSCLAWLYCATVHPACSGEVVSFELVTWGVAVLQPIWGDEQVSFMCRLPFLFGGNRSLI